MNHIYCVGVDHKSCPVDVRERLTFSESRVPDALQAIRQIEDVRECFLVSTCNRTEIYVRGNTQLASRLTEFIASWHQFPEDELLRYRFILHGTDVANHLFRLAGGLESMVIGESEIYHQLKRAFRLAVDTRSVDSVLYQLIERALRVGKKARTETAISKGATSVASVAVELAEKIFGRLTGEQVLVLGTGEMSERALEALVKAGAGKIVVASRSYERALTIAQKFGAEPVAFDEWHRLLQTSDIVITSTTSHNFVVRHDDIKSVVAGRRHKPLFMIDIAVPRNVDPKVQDIDDVYLYNIDDLESVIHANLHERKREIDKCEALVDAEIAAFSGWIGELDLKPTILWLQQMFDEVAAAEIDRSKKDFSGREKELKELLTRVRNKLFHFPLKTMKRASREGTLLRYLQVVRELFAEKSAHQKTRERAKEKQEAYGSEH